MSQEQPEALALASLMESFRSSSHRAPNGMPLHLAVSAELRRLHALTQRKPDDLIAALQVARNYIECTVLNSNSPKTRINYGGCLRRIDAVLADHGITGDTQ